MEITDKTSDGSKDKNQDRGDDNQDIPYCMLLFHVFHYNPNFNEGINNGKTIEKKYELIIFVYLSNSLYHFMKESNKIDDNIVYRVKLINHGCEST